MSIHVSGGGNGHNKTRASTPQNVEQQGNVEVLGAAAAMAAAVASSNYLVLFPFNDWFTAGTLTYPITFLLTDITNRKFGKEAADKVGSLGRLYCSHAHVDVPQRAAHCYCVRHRIPDCTIAGRSHFRRTQASSMVGGAIGLNNNRICR